MKSIRKVIPALALLLVSAVILSSASFAWFTMSRQVTAKGMDVTVTAPNNLLIDDVNDNSWSELEELTVTGVKLVPASSANGKNFFTMNAGSLADGTTGALADSAVVSANTTEATTTTEGAFYDFKYHLKTEGTEAVSVALDSLTVSRKDSTTQISADELKPVRVAILDGTEVKAIYNVTSGTYRTTGKAFTAAKANTDAYSASATFLDTIFPAVKTAAEPTVELFEVAANGTVKNITIRVWFEGEDTSCTAAKCANLHFDLVAVFKAI